MTLARPDDDLVDVLDRLLGGGVLTGDVTISLAGVDLVQASSRALISSVAPLAEQWVGCRHGSMRSGDRET
jgi:Gas vesicle protein